MKVIFLDIDGVLNLFWKPKWDKKCVKNLNLILEYTKAKIVIISTWKNHKTLEELKIIFNKQGIIGEIYGVTPTGQERDQEILEWLSNNETIDWVVIDDKPNPLKKIPKEKLFIVDSFIGLRDEKIIIDVVSYLLK
jgi:hypothetical protein